MKKTAFFLVFSLFLLVFCACKEAEAGVSPEITSENVTSGEKYEGDKTGYFGAMYVMLDRTPEWHKVVTGEPIISEYDLNRIDGSTATIPITAELLRQFYGYSDEKIKGCAQVWHSTTHKAYLCLVDKMNKARWLAALYPAQPMEGAYECSTDIIFVTPPSEEELSYAEEKGVTLDMDAVAMDGFVFITHKNNPVESLTVQQVKDIYSGKVTNWKDIGGEDLPIIAFQREPNSGSQTAMEKLVMQGEMLMPAIETKIQGMSELIDAVAEYKNDSASIGYTYKYYMNNLYKNENIKIININGVTPENENLLSKAYPFATSYYAIIRGDEPEDSPARKLRDYLLIDEGQEVIKMAGYCGIK